MHEVVDKVEDQGAEVEQPPGPQHQPGVSGGEGAAPELRDRMIIRDGDVLHHYYGRYCKAEMFVLKCFKFADDA